MPLSEPMEFQKLSRDVNLISGEWRLASVDEVRSNFEEIKRQGILQHWSILRLLDGWVTGVGYTYELEQGYKSITTMGEMLVVKTNTTRPSNGLFDPEMYSGVELSFQEREVALLLSVHDKIPEDVHFVLYLFAKDAERLAELEKLILNIKDQLDCDC